jgi:hypothetical protein
MHDIEVEGDQATATSGRLNRISGSGKLYPAAVPGSVLAVRRRLGHQRRQ